MRPEQRPRHGDHEEWYEYDGAIAMLRLHDAEPGIMETEIQERAAEGDTRWTARVTDRSSIYDVVEEGTSDEPDFFDTREEALAKSMIIAKEIRSARVDRMPRWQTEDIAKYLEWFRSQRPNRIDYVRLLSANDPNGSYDGLLLVPIAEAEEALEEAFSDAAEEDNPMKRKKRKNSRNATTSREIREFFASQLDPAQEELLDEIVLVAENDGRAYEDNKNAKRAVTTVLREHTSNETRRIREDFDVVRPFVTAHLSKSWCGTKLPKLRPHDLDGDQERMLDSLLLMASNDGDAYRDNKNVSRAVTNAYRDYQRNFLEALREDGSVIKEPAIAIVTKRWRADNPVPAKHGTACCSACARAQARTSNPHAMLARKILI